MMNERICATALYYVDCDNVTSSSLSFQMATSYYLNDDIDAPQDEYHWLERVFGTSLGASGGVAGDTSQNYGAVETKQGRVLAFPNTFQHCVSSFSLKDRTKPGHRRFIALWLVDPHHRIVSTANVPPQQKSWWLEAHASEPKQDVPEGLMDEKEADEHRIKLMKARTSSPSSRLEVVQYNFCEH
jgi:hypothetical protein